MTTANRRYIEWGLQQRYYDATTSLLVESDDLVTSGYTGFQTTRGGAYDVGGGNTVVRGTLIASPLAICATGTLSHVGVYRVKARVCAGAVGEYVRLSWQEGDGPYCANPYVGPATAGTTFSEVDLGLINIPPKQLGTQRWQGRVEAYTTATAGTDTLDVDYLVLVPAGEGYGKVRAAVTADSAVALTARDEFNQTAGGLATKVLPAGGTWTGSGDADDFQVDSAAHTATRVAINDGAAFANGRFGIAGSASLTDAAVQADVSGTSFFSIGVFARYTNTSNFLIAYAGQNIINNQYTLNIGKTVATVSSAIASNGATGVPIGATATIRVAIFASGLYAVWLIPQGGTFGAPIFVGTDADLATGGALATGNVGIFDYNPGAVVTTRRYDNFMAWVPTLPVALYSGRTAEIRHDGAIRQDSTGVYYGNVPAYRGSRFLVPPAGDENRTSRILVKAHRADIEAEPSTNVTDNLTIQTVIVPRYLVVPF